MTEKTLNVWKRPLKGKKQHKTGNVNVLWKEEEEHC